MDPERPWWRRGLNILRPSKESDDSSTTLQAREMPSPSRSFDERRPGEAGPSLSQAKLGALGLRSKLNPLKTIRLTGDFASLCWKALLQGPKGFRCVRPCGSPSQEGCHPHGKSTRKGRYEYWFGDPRTRWNGALETQAFSVGRVLPFSFRP